MKENIEALKKYIRNRIEFEERILINEKNCGIETNIKSIVLLNDILSDVLKFAPDESEFKAGDRVSIDGKILEVCGDGTSVIDLDFCVIRMKDTLMRPKVSNSPPLKIKGICRSGKCKENDLRCHSCNLPAPHFSDGYSFCARDHVCEK